MSFFSNLSVDTHKYFDIIQLTFKLKREAKELNTKTEVQNGTLEKEISTHTGTSLDRETSLQVEPSCSSNLQGEAFIEVARGKRIRIVEIYGDKPIDEVLETFSKYISQFT